MREQIRPTIFDLRKVIPLLSEVKIQLSNEYTDVLFFVGEFKDIPLDIAVKEVDKISFDPEGKYLIIYVY